MKEYIVVPYLTGCLSGTLDEKKLEKTLNQYAAQGWRLSRTIHETRRVWLFVQREAHFLVFERDR